MRIFCIFYMIHFLSMQMNTLLKVFNNQVSTTLMCIHWVEWTLTLCLIIGSYWKIKLVYFAWFGVYIRSLIWVFQWDNIITKYKDDPEMLNEKFTESFYACYMGYLCLMVVDKLIPKQKYIWTLNIVILCLGVQHRCYGLQNFFTKD